MRGGGWGKVREVPRTGEGKGWSSEYAELKWMWRTQVTETISVVRGVKKP